MLSTSSYSSTRGISPSTHQPPPPPSLKKGPLSPASLLPNKKIRIVMTQVSNYVPRATLFTSASPPSSTWSKRRLVPEGQPRLLPASFCLSVRPGRQILRLQAIKRQGIQVNSFTPLAPEVHGTNSQPNAQRSRGDELYSFRLKRTTHLIFQSLHLISFFRNLLRLKNIIAPMK